MMRFEQNSHLRGTCLITGQQPTVDMTSNYKTSMVLFSSVNVIFMLAVVLWITASFSLFYVGGMPRALEPNPEETEKKWNFEDYFMVIGILWNVAGVVYVLVPDAQGHSNIPLNNVVISVVALVASILVQWNWANFRMFDVVVHNEAAKVVMQEAGVPESEIPYGNPAAADDSLPEPIGNAEQNNRGNDPGYDGVFEQGVGGNQEYASRYRAGGNLLQLNTSHFMATAKAVKNYGVHYAKYITHGGQGGLRQRRGGARSASSAVHLGSRMASMPGYTAMVKMGSPIAMYRYST